VIEARSDRLRRPEVSSPSFCPVVSRTINRVLGRVAVRRIPPDGGGHLGRLTTALAVVALLAVSGCQSSAGSSASHGKAKQLPGIKEFGLTEVQFVQHIQKTQALIAQCMADAGFEYIPVDVKTVETAQARVRSEPGYTRRTYKEKWGLGVTTRFDHPVRDTGLGPNLKIWKSLPESDQEAYSHTLWGDDPGADFVWSFDEEDFSSTGGCTRKAVAQVFTPAQLKGTYVNPKDVLVDSDPRIIEALHNWSKCMHARGYDYKKDQDEIIDEYGERLDQLVGDSDPTKLTGTRLAALHKLQQQEIKVSLADVECEIKYADDVYHEVEIEIYGQPLETQP
jgi:hypothetical protein